MSVSKEARAAAEVVLSRVAAKYKYRAWRIDRNGDPQDGVEEEFIARKTQHPDTTAFIMACKALDLRAGESVWLECCFTVD